LIAVHCTTNNPTYDMLNSACANYGKAIALCRNGWRTCSGGGTGNGFFSNYNTHSAAQMMGHQGMVGGAMEPGMMAMQSAGTPVAGMGSMFNANGMSMVDNVQITGASISGSEQKQVQDIWF
jgi:hypothetical protein